MGSTQWMKYQCCGFCASTKPHFSKISFYIHQLQSFRCSTYHLLSFCCRVPSTVHLTNCKVKTGRMNTAAQVMCWDWKTSDQTCSLPCLPQKLGMSVWYCMTASTCHRGIIRFLKHSKVTITSLKGCRAYGYIYNGGHKPSQYTDGSTYRIHKREGRTSRVFLEIHCSILSCNWWLLSADLSYTF